MTARTRKPAPPKPGPLEPKPATPEDTVSEPTVPDLAAADETPAPAEAPEVATAPEPATATIDPPAPKPSPPAAQPPTLAGGLGVDLMDASPTGSKIVVSGTGGQPDVDALFEPVTRNTSRCLVRLSEDTFTGPHTAPVRRLVLPADQVVDNARADHLIAVIRDQYGLNTADDDQG